MKRARLVIENPEMTDSAIFNQLGKTKQLMLAGASDDDIDEDEGTIFGLILDDFRARKITDLEASIDEWKDKYQGQQKELRTGRNQLAKAREQLEDYLQQHRLPGKSNKEIQRILQIQFDSFEVILDQVLGPLLKTKPDEDLSKSQIALVNGWIRQIETLLEEYRSQWGGMHFNQNK